MPEPSAAPISAAWPAGSQPQQASFSPPCSEATSRARLDLSRRQSYDRPAGAGAVPARARPKRVAPATLVALVSPAASSPFAAPPAARSSRAPCAHRVRLAAHLRGHAQRPRAAGDHHRAPERPPRLGRRQGSAAPEPNDGHARRRPLDPRPARARRQPPAADDARRHRRPRHLDANRPLRDHRQARRLRLLVGLRLLHPRALRPSDEPPARLDRRRPPRDPRRLDRRRDQHRLPTRRRADLRYLMRAVPLGTQITIHP